MKKFAWNIIAVIFFTTQLYTPYAFADRYQDAAKDYVTEYNKMIEQQAKNAVVMQFANLSTSIHKGFSPEVLNTSITNLKAIVHNIYDKTTQVSEIIYKAPAGNLDTKETNKIILQLTKDITDLSNQLQRFSWLIRDHIDYMAGAQDSLLQSIKGFDQRCQLGFINTQAENEVLQVERPPNFKADFSVYFGYNTTLGEEGSDPQTATSVTHNEFHVYPVNYADESDLVFLQEAAKVNNTVLGVTSMVYVNAAMNGTAAVAGVATSTLGTATLALGAAGAAIAVAILIVGSFKAYGEQKKWARAEMFKFYNVLDSDDFAKIYRKECVKFNDNLKLIGNVFDRYAQEANYKQTLDAEIEKTPFNECHNFIDFRKAKSEDKKETSIEDIMLTSASAESIFKYYQCVTKVHGPKLLLEISSNEIARVGSKLDLLRDYLTDLIDISSGFKNEFSYVLEITAKEAKLDRLYKNLVVAATGIILGVTPIEDYNYNKKALSDELASLSKTDSLYFLEKTKLHDGIKTVDSYVQKYIKSLN